MTATLKSSLHLSSAPADEMSSAFVHAWLPSVCHRALSLGAQPLLAVPDGLAGQALTAAAMQFTVLQLHFLHKRRHMKSCQDQQHLVKLQVPPQQPLAPQVLAAIHPWVVFV